MSDSNMRRRFSELMDQLGLVYDKDVPPALKRLYWDDLEHLPIEQIERAMRAHRRDPERGRFWPRPADLLARCQDPRLVHPAPDAAWALALESLDESRSVVMTEQIMHARSAALPVWESGDKIGARMAFKAAYEQLLAADAGPPRWAFSPGHDPAHRAALAQRVLDHGLLPRERVERFLPAPEVTPAGAAIAGLLTGNVVGHPALSDQETRERLAEVRRAITRAATQRASDVAERQAKRDAELQARQAKRHGEMDDAEREHNLREAAKALDARRTA